MNEHKICFITCYDSEVLYRESLAYIQALDIPGPYEIETLAVQGATSLSAGYNYAMAQTDAKYKVYLHQDAFIINKSFVTDIIALFNSNSSLGLIGFAGTKQMPLNGLWREGCSNWGKVYESRTGSMELLSFQEVQGDYQSVQAVDGFVLATQYDIPWREDIFDGWDFCDLSQCAEYIRAGYHVGIPRQDRCWVIHDCGTVNVGFGFEQYRQRFIETYAKDLFPLVSVLIPTFNRPAYFEEALTSALQQGYKNIEIIVGDDSIDDETQRLIQPYLLKYPNIQYVRNERILGQFDNSLMLMEKASGEFVNFLMDDELFHRDKIGKMMNYFLKDIDERVAMATSHRQFINGENLISDDPATQRLLQKDSLCDGIDFGNIVLGVPVDLIGGPTAVLFRKKMLLEPFGVFQGRQYICNSGMASWANLLSLGGILYLTEALSYYRIHENRHPESSKAMEGKILDSAHMITTAPAKGFFEKQSDYNSLVAGIIEKIETILKTTAIQESDCIIQELKQYEFRLIEICSKIMKTGSDRLTQMVSDLLGNSHAENLSAFLNAELEQLEYEMKYKSSSTAWQSGVIM